MENDITKALRPLIKVYDKYNIRYYICGSLASSLYGMARSTQDVDIVSDINLELIDEIVVDLKSDYFILSEMITEAINYKSSFNLIHLETMIKIDIFILKDEPYHKISIERISDDSIFPDQESFKVKFSSPEDVILSKLKWYKEGNMISERQWLDVLGIIKVQNEKLDKIYLFKWAKELSILDLLIQAYKESE